ncbi:DsrE family protein [Aquirufa sp. Wall-65K1]
MKKILVTSVFALLFTFHSLAQSPAHKIVIQVNTSDTTAWHGVVRNIGNLQTALGPNTSIEVVAHGSGIGLLIDSKTTQKAKIAELAAKGVSFVACENTIRMNKIDKATILPQSGFVPSGVAEVVLKQEAGWSYLKP